MDIMEEKIQAPFTDDQVKSLNEYQRSRVFHPFTCPKEHLSWFAGAKAVAEQTVIEDELGDEALVHLVHATHIRLAATNEGWFCPGDLCDYTQDWAWAGMADGSWKVLWEGEHV